MEWEEKWWEASDWAGMREMGAEKSGCAANGSAWRETWREAIAFDSATGQPIVERSAHKWAHDAKVSLTPTQNLSFRWFYAFDSATGAARRGALPHKVRAQCQCMRLAAIQFSSSLVSRGGYGGVVTVVGGSIRRAALVAM